jgi:hypothetical protein
VATILVVSLSVVPLAFCGPASADTPLSATCSTVSGGTGRGAQFGTCSGGLATSVGGYIVTSPVFAGHRTRTIEWGANQTDTVVSLTTRVASAKRAVKADLCAAHAKHVLVVTGTVVSDTSGATSVGAEVSATLCSFSNGSFDQESQTVFTF